MSYVLDRQQVLWDREIVAVIRMAQRRVRSQATLRDTSLYRTLTRTRTLIERARRGLSAWPGMHLDMQRNTEGNRMGRVRGCVRAQ